MNSPRIFIIDPGLKAFANERQAQYIDAVNEHGSQRAAARALSTPQSCISKQLSHVVAAAARKGYSPAHAMTRPVPDTHNADRVSTLYDADGKVKVQWVIATLDAQKAKIARDAAYAAMAEEMPRIPPTALEPGLQNDELLNLFTLTDTHIGALSWAKETGADWDLHIAETTLVGCFDHMVRAAPAARVAFVNQLGDFMHYDGMTAVTPLHGNILDADGRFSKMVATAIRVLRRVVALALESHEVVVLLVAEGNHDPAASVWLRQMFAALYENEPRITIIDSELPYYAYQHGKTMLAFHHGHLKKVENMPLLFAAQFPAIWGATTKRYAHAGHRHHTDEKEHSGMSVFQHPTLAARDAYAARGGWISERQVAALTYHKQFGEVARNTVTPDMLSIVVES